MAAPVSGTPRSRPAISLVMPCYNEEAIVAQTVRRVLTAFLFTEWSEGKLFGETPDSAFYVKCDAETNPQEMIDLGRMYVEIGVNPVKPAEFVIIRIGQWTGGGSIMEG